MNFPIILALGCNLGERRETLSHACLLLEGLGVHVVRRSRLYWSRPWGFAAQPDFLNAAIEIKTPLMPRELLARCRGVERELGRAPEIYRRGARWGPRRIDIDIVVYRDVRLETADLKLPHPRIGARDFVLRPLLDLGLERLGGWSGLNGCEPLEIRRALLKLPAASRTIYHYDAWR